MKATFALFIILLASSVSAQEKASEALAEAQIQHERAIDEEIDSLNKRFERDLENLLRKAVSDSDLEGAQLIKAQIAALPHNASIDLLGAWNLKSEIGYSASFHFRSDGTGTRSDSESKFHWFIRSGVIYIGLPQKASDRFFLPARDGKLSGVNLHGHKVTLTKK